MRDAAAAHGERGGNRAGGDFANLESGDVATARGERPAAPRDEPLRHAARCEFADQQFSLPFAAAKSGREVEMADRRVDAYPRYQSAARPASVIVTVYGSAMITMRP